MNFTIGESSLVITAIISFLGVSISAILNYISNIKVNKIRLKHERDKLKLEFTHKAFDILLTASKRFHKMRITKEDEKEPIMKYIRDDNSESREIYYDIRPYISDYNRNLIDKNYKKRDAIYNEFPEIHLKVIENRIMELTPEEITIANDKYKQIHLLDIKNSFFIEKVVNEEIILLSNELRNSTHIA